MPRHWSETLARRYLEGQGYRILAGNYAVRGGEIDLVAEDGGVLVFVEVKQRSSSRHHSPAEAVTGAKLERLRQAALHYMVGTYGRDDLPLRFDVALLTGPEGKCRLEHLKAVG